MHLLPRVFWVIDMSPLKMTGPTFVLCLPTLGSSTHCLESAQLNNRRACSVLKFVGTTALTLAGFLEAGTLEKAAALCFAPVDLPCADILGRKPDKIRIDELRSQYVLIYSLELGEEGEK